jgi:predicted TIM-barrel fold metal-dependent hydrolase
MDVRRMTDYVTGQAKATPEIPNHLVFSAIKAHPDRLWGMVMVNPLAADAIDAFKAGRDAGCIGVKLNPLAHKFSFSGKVVDELALRAGEVGMCIYTHSLFDPGASTKKFAALARRFPGTHFILGHLGFGPADVEAREAARDIPNFYLETSLGAVLAIEEAVKTAGAEKLIFGSEYPMSTPAVEWYKLNAVTALSGASLARVASGTIASLIPSG